MSDVHAIRFLDKLALERSFHLWQHAYFATKPRKGLSVAAGINGAVFRTLIDIIGYTPMQPVGDRDCRWCRKLGMEVTRGSLVTYLYARPYA